MKLEFLARQALLSVGLCLSLGAQTVSNGSGQEGVHVHDDGTRHSSVGGDGHGSPQGDPGHGQPGHVHGSETQAPAVRKTWSQGTLHLLERMAIQDGGRIKPLSTFAGFTLLRLNGKRSVKLSDDVRLGPMEWLLDVLFQPDLAEDQPVFLVQDDALIAAMGLPLEGKRKRDRYSFNELRPGIPKLFDLAHQYGAMDSKDRSSLQEQLVFLAENVNTFAGLTRSLDFARTGIRLDQSQRLQAVMDGKKFAAFHELLAKGPEIVQLHDDLRTLGTAEEERAAVAEVLRGMAELAGNAGSLALIPPVVAVGLDAEWKSPADLLETTFQGQSVDPRHVEVIHGFERVVVSRDQGGDFDQELSRLTAHLHALTEARGEYDKIDLELTYYKTKPITWSLYLFLLAFVATAFLWLRPSARIPYWISWGSVSCASVLLLIAIAMRCVIRNRPPVSTLYETVLFVTLVGASLSLFVEAINRRRVSISAGAVLGMIGLFLANGYEALDKADTMPSLVAVLDTNFWLATHVTAITAGYSAGMFAALLASIYLVAKAVGYKRDDRSFYTGLGRMVYGVIAFGLIFSLVGTVLGGIWANDSWGRFWGWDPKENGALLIVLSQILILHGRLGGFLKEHGVCMAAAFGGTVIAFSWWGVNLLGVGLHSYGFTSGIHRSLWFYYYLQWGVVGLGAFTWLRARSAAKRKAETPVHTLERGIEREAA